MFGFMIFYRVYKNLGEFYQKKILRNIFEIMDVSNFMISCRNNRIIFRFFYDSVFYQYVFCFESLTLECEVIVSSNRSIVNCLVCVYQNRSIGSIVPFDLFLNLLRCEDEYQVYLLLRCLL